MSNHTLKTTFLFGEKETEIEINFYYLPGNKAVGPSYYHGGLPADPPETDIKYILVNGKAANDKQFDKIADDDKVYEQMIEQAEKDRGE